MRLYGLVLIASASLFGACGGGEKGGNTTDTAASATAAQPSAGASTAAAPAAGAAANAAPATGKTIEVKMLGDDKGYRFDPANITVKAGDAIKFVNVTGGPHNVAFDEATTPADVKAQLDANMPGAHMGPLSGPLVSNPNEAYTISFANVKPGSYDIHCTPHLAMGMKGKVTVQ